MRFSAPPTLSLLVRLWRHLSRRRQLQFQFLLGLMLISAFVEVISLGAIVPFLGILVAPDRVSSNSLVADIALVFDIVTDSQLLLLLSVAFASAALIAGVIRLFLLWASTRLAVTSGAELSIELYRHTLYQPYCVHVARNSSAVISGITVKVNGVVFGVLLALLTLISSTVLMVAIMIALIAIDPMAASLAVIGFGGSYGLIAWASRRRLKQNSERIAYEQTQVIKALQEGLGGIRDVLLDGTQPFYCDIYRQSDQPLKLAQGSNAFIASSPRFAIEALGIVMITALAYTLSQKTGGIATALPVLGALALGAQRLLPALQQIYSAWANIASNRASLADTLELLDQPLTEEMLQPAPEPLHFKRDIRFRGVSFSYTGQSPWVLEEVNLVIPKGARVGFVGSTGSGKSTALDLLMGLLTPTKGELLADDQSISNGLIRAWQRGIAHVPQSIYLADSTLAENIAFGVPRNAIDLDRVRAAASQAQIAQFIESEPDGYQAYVGERGIRLSGGQRQRIGIARALYKQASILVFDEATSALDNATEQTVMHAIEGLGGELTILMIAHRLSTVRQCDFIVELKQGRVIAQGTYEELLKCSPSFNMMARST